MRTLVIVESPGKIKKLSAILGAGYRVMASVGHVRDLPLGSMGVLPPDFEPAYVLTARGAEVVARLKKEAAQSARVLLATDPDREGEAIAWHLAEALKLKKRERITFNAITEEKVHASINAARVINADFVSAQAARRVVDRLIGYPCSNALSDKTGEKLSAGRVQSPAVRIVVDRERAISAFKPTTHFGVELRFGEADSTWSAQWQTKPFLAEGAEYVLDQALAERVSQIRQVTVQDFEETEEGRAPAAPFTTSTLQQVAGQQLKMSPKRVMDLAQKLFEQGLITYHRTDAPNLDDAGVGDIADYVSGAGLVLADKRRTWKAKEGAQEGHEAIRPSHASDTEGGEDQDQKALYQLIWQRAVASQLSDARFAVRTAILAGNVDDTPVTFIARGRTLIDEGWLHVYADVTDEDREKDDSETRNPVPALVVGDAHAPTEGRVLTKKTKAPARFKQSTLVGELERQGIGRPSTYAAIMEGITRHRGYLTEDAKGFLRPSTTGERVRDELVGTFSFMELDYTRHLEDQLDQIAEGKACYLDVVTATWQQLDSELQKLDVPGAAALKHACPSCKSEMRKKKGLKGFFWGCTAYPECKTSLPDVDGAPGERQAAPSAFPSEFTCTEDGCGKPLAHRKGTGKKGAYDFWGCTGYPKCAATYRSDTDSKPVFSTAKSAAA